jgi:8-oxo-dGTP pyrophosphatase MutT (NUDIX family)
MFRFIEKAVFREGMIRTRRVESTRRVVPEVDSAIERAWAEVTARPGVRLFDGPLCRFEAMRREGDVLTIDLSVTSYRIVVGTNFANPEFVDRYGVDVMANPVGVSTALQTRDGWLMMGRRNASVAYYPNRVHPFAGSLEVEDEIDLFANVRRELIEELSLDESQIESITCLGLAEDLRLRHPETLYVTRTSLTREQVESQLQADEHHGTWHVKADRDAAMRVVERDELLTPVAQAVLTAWASLVAG